MKRKRIHVPATPCGNCRQLLCDYAPMCEVIIVVEGMVPGRLASGNRPTG